MRSELVVHRAAEPRKRVVHSYERVIHRLVLLSTFTQRVGFDTVMGRAVHAAPLYP
ncbi:hypothetical protein Adu01nite_06790 [Paractinoplanes durhamensis]|uniref:Uncharacterized protein n=1 Tax=Paractinoplanes durhamensis TaxID=113563 RepID=A0ABQ3YP12_9ACTN|nr:hypothetical protein Adu01nite_06790 [Actinoplanes durhamensis]